MILFHTLVSSPGWQVLAASELAAYRVVTRAVNVNLMLIFLFASFPLSRGHLLLMQTSSGLQHPLYAHYFVSLRSGFTTNKDWVDMRFFSS